MGFLESRWLFLQDWDVSSQSFVVAHKLARATSNVVDVEGKWSGFVVVCQIALWTWVRPVWTKVVWCMVLGSRYVDGVNVAVKYSVDVLNIELIGVWGRILLMCQFWNTW